MNKLRIGMLGCGNIGLFLLKQLNKLNSSDAGKIVAIYSRNKEKTQKIANEYGAIAHNEMGTFLQAELDLVVEVATIELISEVASAILQTKTPLIISSIGAFGNEYFLQEIIKEIEENNVHVYIPSGAVGGLDILRSAHALNGLESVQLTTRKPTKSISGNRNLMKEEIVYSGNATGAIAKFPRNMNVAIAISLAGIGATKTKVDIIADPTIEKNLHYITATGDFGKFTMEVSNNAMPNNPNTSYLAALSVLASINDQKSRFKIG